MAKKTLSVWDLRGCLDKLDGLRDTMDEIYTEAQIKGESPEERYRSQVMELAKTHISQEIGDEDTLRKYLNREHKRITGEVLVSSKYTYEGQTDKPNKKTILRRPQFGMGKRPENMVSDENLEGGVEGRGSETGISASPSVPVENLYPRQELDMKKFRQLVERGKAGKRGKKKEHASAPEERGYRPRIGRRLGYATGVLGVGLFISGLGYGIYYFSRSNKKDAEVQAQAVSTASEPKQAEYQAVTAEDLSRWNKQQEEILGKINNLIGPLESLEGFKREIETGIENQWTKITYLEQKNKQLEAEIEQLKVQQAVQLQGSQLAQTPEVSEILEQRLDEPIYSRLRHSPYADLYEQYEQFRSEFDSISQAVLNERSLSRKTRNRISDYKDNFRAYRTELSKLIERGSASRDLLELQRMIKDLDFKAYASFGRWKSGEFELYGVE